MFLSLINNLRKRLKCILRVKPGQPRSEWRDQSCVWLCHHISVATRVAVLTNHLMFLLCFTNRKWQKSSRKVRYPHLILYMCFLHEETFLKLILFSFLTRLDNFKDHGKNAAISLSFSKGVFKLWWSRNHLGKSGLQSQSVLQRRKIWVGLQGHPNINEEYASL